MVYEYKVKVGKQPDDAGVYEEVYADGKRVEYSDCGENLRKIIGFYHDMISEEHGAKGDRVPRLSEIETILKSEDRLHY
ncbi:MAG: hypothetical protein KJ559_02585 [Nanoarchaeota archaeon]|nr:hypothetical protein [Nanoarchaeota archaeon]